jgi:hypothetical protein
VHVKAACVTVNVCPAIVSVPVRAAPPFAAIANVTVPLPVPEAPAVTVIQLTPDAAVHEHPLPAVTAVDPDPPLATTAWLVGAIE